MSKGGPEVSPAGGKQFFENDPRMGLEYCPLPGNFSLELNLVWYHGGQPFGA